VAVRPAVQVAVLRVAKDVVLDQEVVALADPVHQADHEHQADQNLIAIEAGGIVLGLVLIADRMPEGQKIAVATVEVVADADHVPVHAVKNLDGKTLANAKYVHFDQS